MKSQRRVILSYWVFALLWCGTLAAPLGVSLVSPIAAVLAGMLMPVFWLKFMPTTRLAGGTILAFPMAMVQIGAGLTWLIIAVKILTR